MSNTSRYTAVIGATIGAVAAIAASVLVPSVATAAPADVFHERTVSKSKSATLLDRALHDRADMPSLPAHGIFTSGFGPRWGAFHSGIDIANAVGTPILAFRGGEVIDAGPASGYGQWVRLRHRDGSVTVYGHVETVDVTVGQQVRSGEQIATMGNRGFSTGPHLHFEYWPDGQTPVDPLQALRDFGVSLW